MTSAKLLEKPGEIRDGLFGLGVVKARPETPAAAVPLELVETRCGRFAQEHRQKGGIGELEGDVHPRPVGRRHLVQIETSAAVENRVEAIGLATVADGEGFKPPACSIHSSMRAAVYQATVFGVLSIERSARWAA